MDLLTSWGSSTKAYVMFMRNREAFKLSKVFVYDKFNSYILKASQKLSQYILLPLKYPVLDLFVHM